MSSNMLDNNSHRFDFRIYWEDTDAGGVVYYANYLKFAERARTEALRSLGIEQSKLKAEHGIVFVVKRCEIDYLKPCVLDEALAVETSLQEMAKVRMTMHQAIVAGDGVVRAQLTIDIVCVDIASIKPAPIPEHVASSLTSLLKVD